MKRTTRRGAVVAAALALTTVLTACTSAAGANQAPSVFASESSSAPTTAPSTAPQVTVPGVTAAPSTSVRSSSSPSSSTPPPPKPDAVITVEPANTAQDISPVAPVTVTVAAGTLESVKLENAETGVVVDGTLAEDKLSWSVVPVLGFGSNYKVTAVAVNGDQKATTTESLFTTITPNNQTAVAYSFPADGMTVGVGQPVAITFDEPITDWQAAQDAVTITTTPVQEGAFRWISNTELRWRPKDYWQPGTTVAVDVKIYGKDLGDGLYGQKDKQFAFTVGDQMIGSVDDATKILTIKKNGEVVREIPVSMGSDRWPTMNGTYVIAEGYDTKVMDSSTWGLTGTGAYKTEVKYAVRMSSSGIFTHGAPWSEWAQGEQNVSHGCLNMTTEHAKWVYENMKFGDLITITGTKGDPLPVWDGFGDWNMSWDEYKA